MNSTNVSSILDKYNILNQFTGVTLNLQSATVKDIVFYNLKSGGEALFLERLQQSKSQLVFIPYNLSVPCDQVVSVSEAEFIVLQQVLCDHFYPLTRELSFIGITGTNGKTTVAFLGAQILELAGVKAGAIGTLGLSDGQGNILHYHQTTTPSYIDFRKELAQIAKDTGITHLFIELSSHALEQHRLGPIKLAAAGWTNFTQDHLDYHKTAQSYFDAKCKIFDLVALDKFVVSDDKSLIDRLSGQDKLINIVKDIPSQVDLVGDFFQIEHNKKNVALACALIERAGIKLKPFSTAELKTPPGRLDAIDLPKGVAYIDFAHTPDALENVCSALKSTYPEKDLFVVFGCGGDRDATKRPLMGSVVEKYADQIFVTSDNPRSEDPEKIIDDILSGIKGPYIRQWDRSKAIQFAVEQMQTNTILLIAGKGHEDYQEIAGVKHPYSDYDVLKRLMK